MTCIAHVPNPFDFAQGAFRMMARLQGESVGLMTRRTQAYLDLPKTFAHCHSPEDMLAEQVKFWQIAQRQYVECYEQLLSALPTAPAIAAAEQPAPVAPRRDYMVVSERKAEAARTEAAEPVTAVPASRPTIRVRRSA